MPHGAPLTRGGGSKAIWAMPLYMDFSKMGFPNQRWTKQKNMMQLLLLRVKNEKGSPCHCFCRSAADGQLWLLVSYCSLSAKACTGALQYRPMRINVFRYVSICCCYYIINYTYDWEYFPMQDITLSKSEDGKLFLRKLTLCRQYIQVWPKGPVEAHGLEYVD